MPKLVQLTRWAFPQGIVDAFRQLLLFAGAYYAYRIVRGAVDGQANVAFEHGRDLIDAERAMGLFVEPDIQQWAMSVQPVIDVANFMYVNSHFMITTTFLIWLYFARNEAFYYVRNMFMVAMGIALVLYVLYPTAPPRFYPEWGFTDSVVEFVGQQASQSAGALYNPFAAIPSMHIAFALMIAIPAARLVKWRGLKAFWCVYPLLVTFIVIATGNHFWIDAVAGAATAGAAAWAATYALARARPQAWAWHGAPA
ncbi:MAG: phosphatase PAP2 family protein [Thermoleophilaceae bacterium]|nr:phosphatase PAP2 family protein [Thermoleophilaceae bacterium]